MTQREPQKSEFEIVHGNLRNTLRHLRNQLKMPHDAIMLQVEGILRSFEVEDVYEKRNSLHPEPEGPA